MQQIAFSIAHFLEWTFKMITALGWLPVTLISFVLFFGMVYWLNLQGRYNRRAKANGTMA